MAERDIFELASLFSPELPGVSWDALEKQTGKTAATLVYDVETYRGQLVAAWDRAQKIVDTVDLSWELSTKASELAWSRLKAGTISIGSVAVDAMKRDFNAALAPEDEFEIQIEDFRAIVSSLYMSAMYGAVVLSKGLMQKLTYPSEEIIEQLEAVVKTFNLIVFFEENKLLDAIRKKHLQTGAIPAIVVAGAVIAIAAVALIGALAWSSVAAKKISATNKALSDICIQAGQTKDQSLIDACIELSSINKVALESGPDFGMNSITKILLLGGGIYLLVLFGPTLARAFADRQERLTRATL